MRRSVIGISVFFVAVNGYAKEEKWTHYGLRPLAMGNAYVAVADDFNALFYNPAGLARIKEWDGELLNPMMEFSTETLSFMADAQELQAGSAGNTAAVLELIEAQTGSVQHAAFGLTPHLIFPNFGLGIGLELATTVLFHRYPSVDLDFGPRVIAPIVYAHNFLEDRLSLGIGIKAVMRGGVNHEFSIQDLDAFSSKKKSEEADDTEDTEDQKELDDFVEGGLGYGADIGLLFTPIKPMEPTIGLSIMDVGGTAYEKFNVSGEALGKPETRLPAVNMGFSMKPITTQRSYVMVSADFHAINQPYSFSKKMNFGSEFGLGRILKIQGGLHQGYLTGGMQFDVGILNLRLVTYAEELGEVAGSVADRRYALQLKLII